MDEIPAPYEPLALLCAQVKRDKIDSNNASGAKNVASVLSQARMAIDHPIFDPEANRNVLLDHLFLISAGEITKAARSWLVGQLDTGQRRDIIFMDREELLDHAARILLDARIDEPIAISDDDVPFWGGANRTRRSLAAPSAVSSAIRKLARSAFGHITRV